MTKMRYNSAFSEVGRMPETGDPIKSHDPNRVCLHPGCITRLSRYNETDTCSPHALWGVNLHRKLGKPRECSYCQRIFSSEVACSRHEVSVHRPTMGEMIDADPIQDILFAIGQNSFTQEYALWKGIEIQHARRAVARLIERDCVRWDAYERWCKFIDTLTHPSLESLKFKLQRAKGDTKR